MSLPKVSVLVLNTDGHQYPDACRSTLEAQSYPRERFHINIVGSSPDGSCAAYNAAIRNCDSDFVALVGDDARVDPQWLAELVSAADRHQASASASRILDSTGKTIDFAGGTVSFTGHPFPVAAGERVTGRNREDRLLYACCGSALFSRGAFLEAGGFDESFSGGLEDVDLGWRLNLLGHTIVLAPGAVTYRPARGPSTQWAGTRQLRLVERNALAMIYKNYEAATLERVFPAAVALCLMRGLTGSGVDTLTLEISSRPSDFVNVSPALVAHLIALEDFCRQLPALKRRRELIQNGRRRSDAELLGLFGEPLRLHEIDGRYEEVARVLIRDFGIDEMFGVPCRTPMPLPAIDVGEPASDRLKPTGGPVPHLPTASIVILTALGPTHLRECLTSLRQQSYPSDRVEVIVVDNGSADDPTSEVQLSYPGARVVRSSTNSGFAAGNNLGAGVAIGEYLVFLNDDTRVHPDWLRELVGTALSRRAAAVASCILDWSGQRIDFVEGAVNFEGKGFQLNYDEPADSLALEEKPLLFACGCAMLIDRAMFEGVGGWDEGAFAYYEDVELGWRLNLFGHAVWFAPRALVYHKHHGTSGRWPEPPRVRLCERNSLRMLYGLLDTESLQRALPAALLLAADRALLGTKLSRANETPAEPAAQAARRLTPKSLVRSTKAALLARGITRTTTVGQAMRRLGIRGFLGVAREVVVPRRPDPSRRAAYLIEHGEGPSRLDGHGEPLPIAAVAVLSGISGFLSDLPALTRRRAEVQNRRQLMDHDVLTKFGTHWLQACPAPLQLEHDTVHTTLVDEFALAGVSSKDIIEGCQYG